MSKVLVIKATPRDEESRSMSVARAFLEAYAAANPDDEVEWLDLFATDIPEFDALAAAGKYRVMRQEDHTGPEAERWRRVVDAAEHLKSFDKIVVVTPMWNWGIPYRLKLYIDTVMQPGLTFGYGEDGGYVGLVGDKPVAIIASRGGSYTEEEGTLGVDFQLPYLRHILSVMGATRIDAVIAQPTDALGPEVAQQKVDGACAEAAELAARF